jgi:hypothetical protein
MTLIYYLPYFLTFLLPYATFSRYCLTQPHDLTFLRPYLTSFRYALTLRTYVTALRYGLLRHDPDLTVCLLAFYDDITWALRTPYTRPCLQGKCLGLRYGS